jgi:cell division protein FtsQ
VSTPTGRPPTSRRQPSIDPRIRQRRVAVQRGAGRRRLRWILIGLVVAVLVVVGAEVLHTSLFSSKVVVVTGSHPKTPTATILAAAGLEHPRPLIDINPATAATKVETLPYIASAQVKRHWPDGVEVAVTERVPVAVVAGPATSWSQVDVSGRTLAVTPARPAGLPQLIVTTAAGPSTPPPVGKSLPTVAAPGLKVCSTLPLAFSAQVVSVTVAADSTVNLALNSGLTVELGTATTLPTKYEDVAAIIAHGSLRGKKVIDVTVPNAPAVG